MLDYGARLYDPLTARWNGVDALAEKFASSGTYNYVLGNPIRYGDRDGRDTTVYIVSGYSPVYDAQKGDIQEIHYKKTELEKVKKELKRIFDKSGLKFRYVVLAPKDVKNLKLDETDAFITISNSSNTPPGKTYMDEQGNILDFDQTFVNSMFFSPKNGFTGYDWAYISAYLAAHEILHQYIQKVDYAWRLNLPDHFNQYPNLNMQGSDESSEPCPICNRNPPKKGSNLLQMDERLPTNYSAYINSWIKLRYPTNYK